MRKSSLCQEDIAIINTYFPMTTFQIHETKTDQKREREMGKSTVLEMSTTSNHQSIEQLDKTSVSKYTSHVKITDIYDQYAQQNSFHYRENV